MNTGEIVECIRGRLSGTGALREVRMFGGTCFMLNGNMIAGTFRDGLLVRVGRDRQRDALALPGAHAMEMRGRVMEGYVHFEQSTLSEDAVRAHVDMALPFVLAMPVKPEAKPAKGNRK